MTIKNQSKNLFKRENPSSIREERVKEGDKVTKRSGNVFSNAYSDAVVSLSWWVRFFGGKGLESKAIDVNSDNQFPSQIQPNSYESQANGESGNPYNMFGSYEALKEPGKYLSNGSSSNIRNSIPLHEVYGRGI